MDHRQRREDGLLFFTDEPLVKEIQEARRLVQKINTTDRGDTESIVRLAKKLMRCKGDMLLNPPFYCDYGYNIEVGNNCLFNYNCTVLDVGKVRLGDNCLLGPNVSIYTAGHSLHPAVRNTFYAYASDVWIGDNVWIGGSSVICPGVKIGSNTVIGAGSVVTRDIPSWTLAAGNPCRVIREITEDDRKYYFRDREVDEEVKPVFLQMMHDIDDPIRFPVKENSDE